jgi:hypothetical protein
VAVHVADPLVDLLDEPASLGLVAGVQRCGNRSIAFASNGDRRRKVVDLLATQLRLDPPLLVVRSVEPVDRLARTVEPVEEAGAAAFLDLPLCPRLPADPGRLVFAHVVASGR